MTLLRKCWYNKLSQSSILRIWTLTRSQNETINQFWTIFLNLEISLQNISDFFFQIGPLLLPYYSFCIADFFWSLLNPYYLSLIWEMQYPIIKLLTAYWNYSESYKSKSYYEGQRRFQKTQSREVIIAIEVPPEEPVTKLNSPAPSISIPKVLDLVYV